jgi:hypothetical protein
MQIPNPISMQVESKEFQMDVFDDVEMYWRVYVPDR